MAQTTTDTLTTAGQTSTLVQLNQDERATWSLSTAALTGYVTLQIGDYPGALRDLRQFNRAESGVLDGPIFFRFIVNAIVGGQSVIVATAKEMITPFDEEDTFDILDSPSGAAQVGFQQDGAGMVTRTLAQKVSDTYNFADRGAVGDGVTSASAAIQSALDTFRGPIELLPGVYKMTAPLTIRAGTSGIRGRNSTLDFSSLSSGYAITIVPGASETYNSLSPLDGVRVIGPSSEANSLDGVFIGNNEVTGGNTAFAPMPNVVIQGFRDNLVLGGNTWLNSFVNPRIIGAWRYGVNALTKPNAGEQINFHGGGIYNCRNAGGTAVALRVPNDANADINFFGTSFDYNDRDGLIESGSVGLFGCFMENQGPAAKFTVTSYDGLEPAGLVIHGGAFKPSMPSSPEVAGGRTSMIEVTHGSSRVTVRDLQWNRFGKPNTELVRIISGSPSIHIEGTDPVSLVRGDSPYVSKYTNRLANGLFGSDINQWSTSDAGTGTSVATTWNAAGPAEGAGSLQGVGVSATRSRAVFQRIACSAGRKMMIRVWAKAVGLTNGRLVLLVGPENFDQTQNVGAAELHYIGISAPAGQVSVDGSGNTVSADNGWVLLSGIWVPGRGISVARVAVNFDSFVGTGYVSKFYAWEL